METEEKKCTDCDTTENVTTAPCPFAEEIYGNETPVHLCEECRSQRAGDI